nr:DUF6515 family protein [Microbulbifer sp. GX H0434]
MGAFAFSPPADAGTLGHERGGHGWHHGHHYKRWHRHHRHGPRISLGFTAPILPFGFVSLAVGGNPYYYHSGYFYRPAPTGYVVVTAPLGAAVASLPGSAVRVQIGGTAYYQYADAYYQWYPARRAYVVVPPPAGAPVAVTTATPAAPATVPSGPNGGYAPGQVLEELPVGYTAEVVNGVQYYRYGGNYFMPTQRDGREVYVVVQI